MTFGFLLLVVFLLVVFFLTTFRLFAAGLDFLPRVVFLEADVDRFRFFVRGGLGASLAASLALYFLMS